MLLPAAARAGDPPAENAMFPELSQYVAARVAEFDRIPAERQALLRQVAEAARKPLRDGRPLKMTFICTHNSRRSHMGQLWATVAATHYGVTPVETFSGGTQATAFNPRAVAALQRAGLQIAAEDSGASDAAAGGAPAGGASQGKNPRYRVRLGPSATPQVCFSKVYNESPNPQADFIAVMVCSQANEACPNVAGAAGRFGVEYDDPKAADGTPQEAARYDERSAQIAREMLYLFAQIRGESL
jgi:arsenate reductase